jgi:hypothetical protein
MPDTAELLPDGIYFDLDKDRYHNDPALGSTDIRALMVHPAVYWWQSSMNPLHVPSTTDFKDWGNAFHVLVCEGEGAFRDRYYRGPHRSDYRGQQLLVKVDDLKAWLKQKGKASTGDKPTLQKRIHETNPEVLIWDAIVERAEILAGARHLLPPGDFDNILLSSKMITKNDRCAAAFQNGQAEVSVFWTDRWGVRLKCRFDYMHPRAVVDLKSFRNWKQMSLMRAMFNAIGTYRLDVQAAHYLEGRSRVADFIKAGRVFGSAPKLWLDKVAAAEDWRFVWIFYNAEGAPVARRIEYEPLALYHDAAVTEINTALEAYRRYLAVFGTDIWVDVSDKHTLTNEDLPVYMGVG